MAGLKNSQLLSLVLQVKVQPVCLESCLIWYIGKVYWELVEFRTIIVVKYTAFDFLYFFPESVSTSATSILNLRIRQMMPTWGNYD